MNWHHPTSMRAPQDMQAAKGKQQRGSQQFAAAHTDEAYPTAGPVESVGSGLHVMDHFFRIKERTSHALASSADRFSRCLPASVEAVS